MMFLLPSSPHKDFAQFPLTFQAVSWGQTEMARASCPCSAPPTTDFWFMKNTNPLLPQASHGAEASLLCFPRCSRGTCFLPHILQELAPVCVLGNPMEASASYGREETGRPYFSTCFIPPGNPYFLHFILDMQLVRQISSLAKTPTLPGT